MSRIKFFRPPPMAVNLAQIASLRVPQWWLDEYFGPLERFVAQIHEEGAIEV